ncbi:hypothetical protein J3R30DRAFT_3411916 [Lentinula aciculospora]|uniref:Uncharacterized protein n=1 Tax=Lentinula aciculospora TaxID=153920 RepID=A0A9W9DF25_9AGAR|nr:hypothetical protein J3R30DRAFT_3411916 [Lentinula aciculospora]
MNGQNERKGAQAKMCRTAADSSKPIYNGHPTGLYCGLFAQKSHACHNKSKWFWATYLRVAEIKSLPQLFDFPDHSILRKDDEKMRYRYQSDSENQEINERFNIQYQLGSSLLHRWIRPGLIETTGVHLSGAVASSCAGNNGLVAHWLHVYTWIRRPATAKEEQEDLGTTIVVDEDELEISLHLAISSLHLGIRVPRRFPY